MSAPAPPPNNNNTAPPPAAAAAAGAPSAATVIPATNNTIMATTTTAAAPGTVATTTTTTATATAAAAGQQQQQQQDAASTAAAAASAAPTEILTDQAVLDYLKRKGMGTAALELTKLLEEQAKEKKDDKKQQAKTERERLEQEDTIFRNQRTLLAKSTGGSFGFDRDSAWPVVQWGMPDVGRRRPATKAGADSKNNKNNAIPEPSPMGVDEARSYLDAFVNIQLWVLSLPDGGGGGGNNNRAGDYVQYVDNPVQRAQELIHSRQNAGDDNKPPTLADVMKELTKAPPKNNNNATNTTTLAYNLPPSAKPELLACTFALLVHTYCELLEVGMESTAHCIRDAFQPIYEPLYPTEFRDLLHCTTTEGTMRLNSHNSQHMEALNALKSILVRVAHYQLKREELLAASTVSNNNNNTPAQPEIEQKMNECDRNIHVLQQQYKELSQRAAAAFEKMHDLPFLRRARAVRWQLHLSTATYTLLTKFLNQSGNDALLPMSNLLQTKCELQVVRRDPLPFTPACVLLSQEETIIQTSSSVTQQGGGGASSGQQQQPRLDLNQMEICWAAPAMSQQGASSLKLGEKLPFPKFQLDAEYETEQEAAYDRRRVEFNRALLTNGFRRLEALEKKRTYEALPVAVQKRLKNGDASVLKRPVADPFAPSILLTTLTSNISGPVLRARPSSLTSSSSRSNASAAAAASAAETASIWEEAGIGICCARLCQPDGRRVAVGCDDSSVRIYDVAENSSNDPSHVLLGHKNGFPVFDVDWNRDGRCVLSAAGDGSVRLWDTMAVGPFGEVASVSDAASKKDAAAAAAASKSQAADLVDPMEPEMNVPGLRAENTPYSSGAALAVYRGHAPSSPVWSVSFSPSGYYFATAAADATARLWTTDRTIPVRLFTGHTAANVNCVDWHPNCNYILTGSDDKTCRMWDVHTGRTVRLLSGGRAGINSVKVSPDGRFAVGADYSGSIHMWDLGNGKKLTEFRPPQREKVFTVGSPLIHSMSFSACGRTIAAGGDDCCVRIWDAQSETVQDNPFVTTPSASFATNRSLILDLQYTKRNLLLSVGKLVTPVPLAK